MYFESSSSKSFISSLVFNRAIVSRGTYFSKASCTSLCKILLVLAASEPPFSNRPFPELIESEQIFFLFQEKKIYLFSTIPLINYCSRVYLGQAIRSRLKNDQQYANWDSYLLKNQIVSELCAFEHLSQDICVSCDLFHSIGECYKFFLV